MSPLSHSHWRALRYRSDNDFVCGNAAPWLTDIVQGLFREAMLARIAPHLAGRRLAHALDLGCGVGDWTAGYLGIAQRATGVDINEDFVGAARRRASVLGVADRLGFEVGEIEAFPIDSDVDFVGLGGCLMYVSDVEVNRLLTRIADAIPAGALVYVRSTVVTPLRRRHETDVGVYRDKAEYETLFRANALRVIDCAFSTAVVAEYVAGTISHPGVRGLLVQSLGVLGRVDRAARDRTEFCNWLLRRLPMTA